MRMIEAFRNFWFQVPCAAIMLICDIIIAIIYTAYTFIAEWRFYHRGPRHGRKNNSISDTHINNEHNMHHF